MKGKHCSRRNFFITSHDSDTLMLLESHLAHLVLRENMHSLSSICILHGAMMLPVSRPAPCTCQMLRKFALAI